MSDIASTLGAWFSLLFLICLLLLFCGANLFPDWAKSKFVLLVIGVIVVLSANPTG